MKKSIVVFSIIVIVLVAIFASIYKDVDKSYLRIHIRANSNAEVDQLIKYTIKDEIVTMLTPLVVGCTSFDEVKNVLEQNLENINRVADRVLSQKGLLYTAKSKLSTEMFPTRKYNEFVLEEGVYDALIVELGEAKGDNWWCVIYPPLCFTSTKNGSNVVYKSRIIDMINAWKNRK